LRQIGGVIAKLHIAFRAIKKLRRDHGIAGRREIIAKLADMAVHTKNFLRHHQGARGILRAGAIGLQAKTISSGKGDHRHGRFPSK
jgi:hypothetical protein